MVYYKINEFAKMIQISPNTLRTWGDKGILAPHHRTPTGIRFYSEEQVTKYFNGDYNKRESNHEVEEVL